MKYICPKCSGRLEVAREGVCGSCDTAGDIERHAVTLQCTRCGYRFETDEQTARDAAALGPVYERLCAHGNPDVICVPDLDAEHCPMEQRNVYKFYGAIHRDEERQRLGLDLRALKEEIDQIQAECEQQLQALNASLDQCADQSAACEQQLRELAFFHWIKRFSLWRKLSGLKKETCTLSGQKDACSDTCQQKIDDVVTDIVDRCRLLAVDYMEKYAPEEYKDLLYFLYSILDSTPMKASRIAETYEQKLNGMTQLQIIAVFNNFTNPFVSKASMSDGFYFGPERKASRSLLLERLVEPEQLEPLERAARELYGDKFTPYHPL